MTDEKMYPLDPGTWVVPPGNVRKLSGYVQIPNEMLPDGLAVPLAALFRPQTPEEIAAGEARRAAATAAVQAAYRAVLADAGAHRDATAVTVLELHRPSDDGRWCEGCDGGPDDSGEWPCRTTLTVARLLGVEVPGDPWRAGYRSAAGDQS